MTTVTETLALPGGASPKQVTVTVFLAGEDGDPYPAGYATADGETIVDRYQLKPSTAGVWSLDLVPNDAITPAGTVWGIVLSGGSRVDKTPRFILVPAGGPYTVEELLTDPPAAIASSALAVFKLDYYAALALDPDGLIVGAITRDSNGAATSADVVWPDGTPGTYTADEVSTAFPGAVDAYHVTYGTPATRTYTQPAVTRDENGAVTNRPALVVS